MNEAEREVAAHLRRLGGALNRSAASLPRRVDALTAAHRAEQASGGADMSTDQVVTSEYHSALASTACFTLVCLVT
jgi:hypothetical protein